MRVLLPLLLLAGMAQAEFSYIVQKSEMPEDATIQSGLIVVQSGGLPMPLDQTGIVDGGTVYEVVFNYDTTLFNGDEIEVGFLTIACGIASFQRSNESSYFYSTTGSSAASKPNSSVAP